MGRLVYWMNVSMDLRIEHRANEQGGGSWMRITDALHRDFNDRARKLAAGIQGRIIHETMESFWPSAANDPSVSQVMRDYGKIWVAMPKYLVSNTRKAADYNTQIIGGPDVIQTIATIRAETSGDIGVGGATLATQVLKAGLLDELMLYVHPTILGGGRPLFDGEPFVETDLLESVSFPEGVVFHRSAIRKSPK
jgi:dihydrofolate reductase